MSKAKKPYVKPEIMITPPNSPKCNEMLHLVERQSRGQRFDSAAKTEALPAEES